MLLCFFIRNIKSIFLTGYYDWCKFYIIKSKQHVV